MVLGHMVQGHMVQGHMVQGHMVLGYMVHGWCKLMAIWCMAGANLKHVLGLLVCIQCLPACRV